MKCNNICIIEIPLKKTDSKGLRTYLKKKMTENISNLVKKKYTHAQKVQRVPNKMDPKRPTPRHTITKMAKLKDKDRI